MLHTLGKALLGTAACFVALTGCSHSQPPATGAGDDGPQPMREVSASAVTASAANEAAIASHQSSEIPPGLPDGESPTDAAREAAAKPFMFDEASLPQGFPPVGPVGVVVVKQYPAHRLAQVQAAGVGGQNAMFNPLFNHIKRNKIAMTAPVQMEYDAALAAPDSADNASRQPQNMAFFYRDPDLGAVGTDARDARVQVVDVPAVTVVSVALRGGYGGQTMQSGLRILNNWLAANPQYRVAGPPRFMGYNSPFVPWFLRMSEVQIPVVKQP
jgi:hypothetical protein